MSVPFVLHPCQYLKNFCQFDGCDLLSLYYIHIFLFATDLGHIFISVSHSVFLFCKSHVVYFVLFFLLFPYVCIYIYVHTYTHTYFYLLSLLQIFSLIPCLFSLFRVYFSLFRINTVIASKLISAAYTSPVDSGLICPLFIQHLHVNV